MLDQNKKLDVYDIVTERIVGLLDKGIIPWNSPYDHDTHAGWIPRNLISNKEYRGINRWLLMGRFDSPFYISRNQCEKLGGRIKQSEWRSNSIVTWWDVKEYTDEKTGEITKRWNLRFYKVWNIHQCEGLKHKRLDTKLNDNRELVKPAAIVKGMPKRPTIKQDSPRVAYYRVKSDEVHIGKIGNFKTSADYYATLFHELIHSTGHESRLNRGLAANVVTNKSEYSREELTAEMGSAYLCEMSGIGKPTLKNAVAYIQHWRAFLLEDPKAVVAGALRGQKACDYIHKKCNDPHEEE